MAGLRTPMPRSWVRHTEGGVTVRERLSATIELTVPSQDGRLRTPGDSKGAATSPPPPLGCSESSFRSTGPQRRGVYGSCPEHMTVMGPGS